MKCLKLPSSVANKIDSLISRFLWDWVEREGINWVRRAIVNTPKSMGGLGIRSIEPLNDSLLLNQAMRLHNDHDLLVSRVIFSPQGVVFVREENKEI